VLVPLTLVAWTALRVRPPPRNRARPKNSWAASGVGRGHPAWGL